MATDTRTELGPDLFSRLSFLSGHLQPSQTEQRAVHALQERLAVALRHEDLETSVGRRLSILGSDLFSPEAVAADDRTRLATISRRVSEQESDPELRVFVRDVPTRAIEMSGAVPQWASGAAVQSVAGPFLNKDGRQIWYDFFAIRKLVALYVAGQVDPALLFDVSLHKIFINGRLPLVDPAPAYELVPDTVWIRANLLAANAPASLFCALRITGGLIRLSAKATVVDGRLTMATATRATVTLDLDQPAVTDADSSSPYGDDARSATLALPGRLQFHFTAAMSAIDEVTGSIGQRIYGETMTFRWDSHTAPTFDQALGRVLIPLASSAQTFAIRSATSSFFTPEGSAPIQRSAWALPAAAIDVAKPSPAAGVGGLLLQCTGGIAVRWSGLIGGDVQLRAPSILHDPGAIGITDVTARSVGCTQRYQLWRDARNRFGSSIDVQYTQTFPLVFVAAANGSETLATLANTNPRLDRPVTASGFPFDIHSQASLVITGLTKALRLIYLFDDNILFDTFSPNRPGAGQPVPLAIALRNALFKVTPVNGCLLFGALANDLVRVERGAMFLAFGVYAYLPTLPDPYAASLGVLRAQFSKRNPGEVDPTYVSRSIWLSLVSLTAWQPDTPTRDQVVVSFHFVPLTYPFQVQAAVAGAEPASRQAAESPAAMADRPLMAAAQKLPDYQAIWNDSAGRFQADAFALLDVSSNADQMGVSFSNFGGRRFERLQTLTPLPASGFPFAARGLDVVSQGQNVKAFTVPQISWEPVVNLTPPEKAGDPPSPLNYYPNDGGPTRIGNNSVQMVPIAPIPVCEFLVDAYDSEPNNVTAALMTLPWGLRSLAYLDKHNNAQTDKPQIEIHRPAFSDDRLGALALRLTAGSGFHEESASFRGATLQVNNVLDAGGAPSGASTLGYDVTVIFNGDFFESPNPLDLNAKGVPLTQIDLSGYGASTVSNWVKRNAKFASTSQCTFEIFLGRTAHQVIQVRSILYPWGIRVVRTITMLRAGSAYVYRVDSGWKAESDGRFDFRFQLYDPGTNTESTVAPYTIHPGVVKGLFNVKNIRTALADVLPVLGTMDNTNFLMLDADKRIVRQTGGPSSVPLNLQPVYFDADVELESIVQGAVGGRLPSRKILGFVQLAPPGIPITPLAFKGLLDRQFGAIGGPLDGVMDIGKNGQRIRINRLDVNSAVDVNGIDPVFVAAARGSVVLPKDGAWSLVSHARGTGEVTPLPESTTVPIIRVGQLAADMTYPDTALLRIANPADLVRPPSTETVNFGFLQSTNTQKVLFLTPAFAGQAVDTIPGKLMSKTPPLFVDAYRLLGSKAIFPNIGDAATGFGDAIALTKDFAKNALQDGGTQVLELMSISSADGIARLKEDGYKLLNAVQKFDLPTSEWYLIDEDYLKVYVEYKAATQNRDKTTQNRAGVLNYDINSFAANVGDRWKSRLNNIAMVVDLGPLKRLMTVKGNFDARKGADASYVGSAGDPDFAAPQISFSKELQPVIDILEILEDLQGENYADAVRKGLKIAMSNSADGWEYKFEAAKEIPVLKFPVPDFVYNDPNCPFKLQASMKIGFYFNAALTTTALSDPKKLLPTAGAFVEFFGRLSVMCVSLSVATVYAVGQVDLRLAGDTRVGPSLLMKFGFGAQVVVGLPVVGSVSLLYVVGIEIYVDSTKLNISAFMLFQGQAELLGGLIGVTITIEAKGTILKTSSPDRTDLIAQVTFGLDISIFLVIDISFSKSWQEQRQIA